MKPEKTLSFYRVAKENGRWWFISPNGNKFISKEVGAVRFARDHDQEAVKETYNQICMAKYGSEQNWRRGVVERLAGLGFNTIGAWSEEKLSEVQVANTHMAETIDASIGTHFVARVHGGNAWSLGIFPDVFDASFEEFAFETARKVCFSRKDDDRILGWFTDNELRWGPDWRGTDELLTQFLGLADTAPGRRVAIEVLGQRYKDIQAFNEIWQTSCTSWDALINGEPVKPPVEMTGVWGQNQEVERIAKRGDVRHAAFLDDCDAFLGRLAERYFSVTANALKAADSNHLNLGCRFAYVPAKPVVAACARYVDCISFNSYHMDPREIIESYAEFDKPVMITEFSFKARDSGLPNKLGAGPLLGTQTDRADGFTNYVRKSLSYPHFIGYHWFRYTDNPPDSPGENSNFGIVTLHDDLYQELTHAMSKVNAEAEDVHETEHSSVRSIVRSLGPIYTADFSGPSSPAGFEVELENIGYGPITGQCVIETMPPPKEVWRFFQGGYPTDKIPDIYSNKLQITSCDETRYTLQPGEKKIVRFECVVKPNVRSVTIQATLPGYWDRIISCTADVECRR